MHYHLVLVDEEGEHVETALTFARQADAEAQASGVAQEIDGPGWNGTRYPGRTWRPHEVAVYLDRRPLVRAVHRLELTIIRCDAARGEHDPRCYLHHRGRPW
jgi:hypothetical protein